MQFELDSSFYTIRRSMCVIAMRIQRQGTSFLRYFTVDKIDNECCYVQISYEVKGHAPQ